MGDEPTHLETEHDMLYINSRAGIRDATGTLVGSPDKGSITRTCHTGTFNGEPVMGFWRAVRQGHIEMVPQEEPDGWGGWNPPWWRVVYTANLPTIGG